MMETYIFSLNNESHGKFNCQFEKNYWNKMFYSLEIIKDNYENNLKAVLCLSDNPDFWLISYFGCEKSMSECVDFT